MIIDAFQFYNELDLLEIRLHTLDPIVDYFIISEATKTHSGLPKPLYFAENKERYARFLPKIIHQILTDIPEDYTNLSPDTAKGELHILVIDKVNRGDWWPHNVLSYGRDTFHKESLLMAMKNCKPDDIIMVSDADEIPRPETIEVVVENFDPNQIYNLKQKMYFYYFNCLKEDNWIGNTLLTFNKLKTLSICELRVRRRGIMVDNGGWHFSYMGGIDKIRQKLESFGEQSLNTEYIKNSIHDNVENCIARGHDLFFRPCKFWIVPIDETYPKYIIDNLDNFKAYIKYEQ